MKFQYLSESIKQFESNTIWKTLGGSHYLRTCHREEISTLNFRRNWSHLGLAGIIPLTALAEHITIWVLPSSLFTFFPLKRRTGRNPTLKVPDEAPPTVLYPWVSGVAPGKHDKTPASSLREVPSARAWAAEMRARLWRATCASRHQESAKKAQRLHTFLPIRSPDGPWDVNALHRGVF